MHQLAKKTLPEKVLESIENEILAGKYAIGDKIPPEPELVQHFNVSRNSIREAVQSLIHAGILEARQGSGTYVVGISRLQVEIAKLWGQCDIEEISKLRILFGKIVVKSASKKRSDDEAKTLEEKANQLKDYLKNIKNECETQTENRELVQEIEESNLELVDTKNIKKTKKIKKKKKKNLLLHLSSTLNGKQNQENCISLVDSTQLRILDHEYILALTQGAHNNSIAPLFVALQSYYLTHVVKENKDIWDYNIKLYGQLATAITKKDTKAIKKLIDILYY